MTTRNALKTTVLLTAAAVPFVLAGGLIGGTTGAVIAALLAVALGCVVYWFSDRIVLAALGAREAHFEEFPDLHLLVERLAQQTTLPKPRLFLIDAEAPNAFSTGRNPSCAALAVTTGLQHVLDREELAGVIAHELAHIQYCDTLVTALVAAVAGAILALIPWAEAGRRGALPRGRNGVRGLRALRSLTTGILMVLLGSLAAMLVRLAIPRSREYEADALGAQILGDPLPLAGALQKLEGSCRACPMHINPAMGHQFIVQPFRGGGLMSLFSTHPSISERVARLHKLALCPMPSPSPEFLGR